jgi:phospholipase D1/2
MLYPMTEVSLSLFALSKVLSVEEYEKFVTRTKVGHVADYSMPVEDTKRLLSSVRGHIVNMPLHYMDHTTLIKPGLMVNEFTGLVY